MHTIKWGWVIPLLLAAMIFMGASKVAESTLTARIVFFVGTLCFVVGWHIFRGDYPGNWEDEEEPRR